AKWPMRHLAMTGIDTAAMISRIFLGLAIRATPPSARICAGTRSRAITDTAPACSAMTACSALVTSMMTPPLSISARPVLRRREVVLLPLFWDMSGTLWIPFRNREGWAGGKASGARSILQPVPNSRYWCGGFSGLRSDSLLSYANFAAQICSTESATKPRDKGRNHDPECGSVGEIPRGLLRGSHPERTEDNQRSGRTDVHQLRQQCALRVLINPANQHAHRGHSRRERKKKQGQVCSMRRCGAEEIDDGQVPGAPQQAEQDSSLERAQTGLHLRKGETGPADFLEEPCRNAE